MADTIPIYPLYALLFADVGLSGSQISGLFVIWSMASIVAEVPTGALADRYSRRAALVAAGVLQACGYVVWTTLPGYRGFAAGFVLWGVGGAVGSGALEALVFDGLAVAGAEERFPRIYGRVRAMGQLSQLPSAAAATILFSTGGYVLVGWASVACCLAAAAVASRLPDIRPGSGAASVGDGVGASPAAPPDSEDASEPGYFAVLRSGLAEAARRPAVRGAVVAVALLGGLDGLEEYFPLLVEEWGVPTPIVPLAVAGIPLVGAVGAALGGRAAHVRGRRLAAAMAVVVVAFAVAGVLRRPVGVVGIALAYGLYQLVLVVTDTRLQGRIEGPARATVTSVASLGSDLTAVVLYGLWALGQPAMLTAAAVSLVVGLPWLLRPSPTPAGPKGRRWP